MPDEIKGSPAQLEASADNIEQNAATISRELQAINDSLNTLRRTFMGQRAAAFYKQYDPASQEMQELIQLVRALANDLRDIAGRLRAADQA